MADATPQSRDDDVKFAALDFVGDNYLTRSPMARRQLGQTNTQLRRHIGEARNDRATRIQSSMKTPMIHYEYDGSAPFGRYYKNLANMKKEGHNFYDTYRSGLKNVTEGRGGEYDGTFGDRLKRPIDQGR